MARALPSAIPAKMYRHFALITVLLTMGVAMFAEGENREAAATQIEPRETPQRDDAEVVKPPLARGATGRHQRSHHRHEFDGFDTSFGEPMDSPRASRAGQVTLAAPALTQTGYSNEYLASLDAE